MKTFRYPQWVWMSGWVAAAVVLWSMSFAKLSELVYRPLPPSGVPANQLRMKLRVLEQRLTEGEERGGSEAYRIVAASFKRPAEGSKPLRVESEATHDSESPKSGTDVSLPRLSGILRTVNCEGREEFSALFEGNVYSHRGRVQGFVLEKISAEGVVLSREGRRWHIPAPEVYFSIQRSP